MDDHGEIPEDDTPSSFFVHHFEPILYGYPAEPLPEPLLSPPTIDPKRANRPITPGMPLLKHVPLPSTASFKLSIVHSEPDTSSHHLAMSDDRIAFPVAKPPQIHRLTPVPAPSAASPPIPIKQATSIREQTQQQVVEAEELSQFDPMYLYLLFLAMGVGTAFMLDYAGRYVTLWTTLLVFGAGASLLNTENSSLTLTSEESIWGAGIGVMLGLPLLFLSGSGLAETARTLFPDITTSALFQLLILTVPFAETLFFRETIQADRGPVVSMVAAGIGSLVLYWPAAIATPISLGVAVLFSTALAGVYSYIRVRHRLGAALIAQIVVNFFLLFLPGIVYPAVL